MEDNFYDGDYYERHHYTDGGVWSLQRVSFVFTDGWGTTLDRCDFTVNPSSMQYNYPDRNVFIQTLGRYPAMQGYGAGLHTIQISGQTGYHKSAIMAEGATGPDTNYGQAKKLKGILMKDENQAHDDFDGDGVNMHANSQLWFMNYTDGVCYQVELSPQAVQFSRTNNDPLTYYYTISMTVIRNLKYPFPSEMTVVTLGNDHDILPTDTNSDDNDSNTLPFNVLYSHPIIQSSPEQDYEAGRSSILDPPPKQHINTLEDKPDNGSNPNNLSIGQKANIMSAIDNQNNTPHTMDLGAFNVKVNSPQNDIQFWTNRFRQNDNNSVSATKPIQTAVGSGTPTPTPPTSKPNSNPNLPVFVGVTDGNGIHVLVPSQNLEQIKPQPNGLDNNSKETDKRFFRNTQDDSGDSPLSNLINGNLTVSEVISDSFGNLTVEPLSPNMPVPNYQKELTTITDQNNAFVIQPNQFSSTDIGTPVPTQATTVSSDYIQVYRENNQLVLMFNGKAYTNPNNSFVLSDSNNQMTIGKDIDSQADDWLEIDLKGGNIFIKPSGPQELNDNNYYLYGLMGSHTVYDQSYMIVPNDNKHDTVFDAIYQHDSSHQYSANTKNTHQSHYGLDSQNNIHLVNVNGNIKQFHVSQDKVTNKPQMDMNMKYNNTKVNPDIIQGQTSKQFIQTLKGSDDNG